MKHLEESIFRKDRIPTSGLLTKKIVDGLSGNYLYVNSAHEV